MTFETSPDQYKHWRLTVDGNVATLTMDVREDAGLRPNDYKLKLNSDDLGVDIELADVLQRLRFEHPEVYSVVLTSLKPRIFCAGANIFMLGASSHAFKVNFCKFTNETRLGMEDMSAHSGIKFMAAVNGICAGGGYELALGPPGFQDSHQVYLRTAISVDAAGWAHFDYVRLPEYRWGIFLAEPTPDRRIGLGDFKGQPGQFADYIAPPQRGITRQLIDFEYVRTEQ